MPENPKKIKKQTKSKKATSKVKKTKKTTKKPQKKEVKFESQNETSPLKPTTTLEKKIKNSVNPEDKQDPTKNYQQNQELKTPQEAETSQDKQSQEESIKLPSPELAKETQESEPSIPQLSTAPPESDTQQTEYKTKSYISDDQSQLTPQSEANTQEEQSLIESETVKKTSRKWLFLLIFLLAVLLLSALAFFIGLLPLKQEFYSPIPDNPSVLSYQIDTNLKPKEIIGFLPYWNINQEENFRYNHLTQIAFFALEIDLEGNIRKMTDNNSAEPGWLAYQSQSFGEVLRKTKEAGGKMILTIQSMDADTIASIVNDRLKRKRVIDQTIEIIDLKNLDGVNIDFEYATSPPLITTNNFSKFIQEFDTALEKKNENLTLSVDVFADTITKVRIWDISKLIDYVDYIIIMAYDFHRASSRRAGPVAPIRGSPKYWEYDISKSLNSFSKIVPLKKVILGVPYYGYEWRTSSEEPYSPTYPNTGALATFKRVQSLIDEKQPNLDWDEIALSPRLSYIEAGQIQQIYYENEISLGLKYDLVNNSGLGGIAIWALGYDGSFSNLWNLLAEKFPQNKPEI